MRQNRFGKALALLALCGFGAAGGAAAQEAHFTVRTDVVTPDLLPFTATIGAIGNGADLLWHGGGFEPVTFRTMILAGEDAANSILADSSAISHYDSWREGALDGAEVEVLRITGGEFATVRRDRIARGGHLASGWHGVLRGGHMLPADRTRVELGWDRYNRLDAPWYYTVRAVNAAGDLSRPASAIAIRPPAEPGRVEARPETEAISLTGRTDERLAAPDNLRGRVLAPRTLMLEWEPVPGAAGYVVYRADHPPEAHRGYRIDLEGEGAAIRRGDMVLIRKEFREPRREEVATHRIWNAAATGQAFGVRPVSGLSGDPGRAPWRLVAHAPDSPVEDPGTTYLEVDLTAGRGLSLGEHNHSGTAQSYYSVLDPADTYRFEVWLRGEGEVTATFDSGGAYRNAPGLPARFRPTAEWRKYSAEFRVPALQTSAGVNRMSLDLSGTGRIDVDNLRIYRSDAPYLDLLPEDRAALEASGMSMLRTHAFIKSGTGTYDLAKLTNPGGGNTSDGGNSLPQTLAITESLGMDPWLQIEPHFSREEWLGLAEYLAAPFDPEQDDAGALPWAAKRAGQGRAAPWTEAFGEIYFEIGNETWNNLFRPWVFPGMRDGSMFNFSSYSTGEVYGLYQEHVLSILRESPWWDRLEPSLVPVLGGWAINNYGIDAARMSPHSRVLGHAAYIGGWDSGEGPVRPTPEGYASVMAFTPQHMEPNALRYRQEAASHLSGRELILGTYESGPGYALDGLNNAKVTAEQAAGQERVMKSAAAGAATLDSFLIRARAGERIQNFFTFGRGDYWKSHAPLVRGGQAYPSWSWLALFNREGLGDMLAVETLAVPRQDIPEMGRRQPLPEAPMVAAYATRRDDRLTIAVISRKVPGTGSGGDAVPVRIDLPIGGASRLTRYRMSGDYRAENTSSEEASLVAEELPLPADPARLEIPALAPASAELYVFEGVTPPPGSAGEGG